MLKEIIYTLLIGWCVFFVCRYSGRPFETKEWQENKYGVIISWVYAYIVSCLCIWVSLYAKSEFIK